MLYVVATPLGNMKDITIRAREMLAEVDEWVVEDTRRAGKLRDLLDLPKKPLNSYYDEVEQMRVEPLIEKLKQGSDLALLSDAGTPAISDPGYLLIKRAHDEGIEVRPLPGACAPLVALSVSGFPSDQFLFIGFLPKKSKAIRDKLLEIKHFQGTVICFESPQRFLETLRKIRSFLGDRRLFIAREMTKKFEEYRRANCSDLIKYFEQNKPQGEFTLLIHPREEEKTIDPEEYLRELLKKGLKLSDAAKAAASFSPQPKSELYKKGLAIQEEIKKGK
ncbi:MAG: 16S rRNA (cytidine(1402)-2'-O)-methyltransferase [bacterium]